jgi:hypothetical protein
MFRKPGGELDVMQVQRVLEKNAELELVVSSPNPPHHLENEADDKGWWM